jgi:hypothetical protein
MSSCNGSRWINRSDRCLCCVQRSYVLLMITCGVAMLLGSSSEMVFWWTSSGVVALRHSRGTTMHIFRRGRCTCVHRVLTFPIFSGRVGGKSSHEDMARNVNGAGADIFPYETHRWSPSVFNTSNRRLSCGNHVANSTPAWTASDALHLDADTDMNDSRQPLRSSSYRTKCIA